MELNNPKNITKIEEDMQNKLKPIIQELKKSEQDIKNRVLENSMDFKNKIDVISQCNIFPFNDQGEFIDDIITPDMQQEVISILIKKLEFQDRLEANDLKNELEKIRKEANRECKSIFDEAREQLEKQVTDQKEKLEEVNKKIQESYQDVSQIEATIKFAKLKPENRAFKALITDKDNIINERKKLKKEQKEIEEQVKISETELQEFNSKYEKVDFESENGIVLLIEAIYGNIDFDILMQAEEELNKEGNNLLENEEPDGAEPPENKEPEGTKTPENEEPKGAEPPKNDKPEGTKTSENEEPKGAKPPKSDKPEGTKTPENKEPEGTKTPKKDEQEGNNQSNDKKTKKENRHPKMFYNALFNEYEIIDDLDRREFFKKDDASYIITKDTLAEELDIDIEELENMDMGAVAAWINYDEKYKTDEARKYIQSILYQDDLAKNVKLIPSITYDLTKLHKNRKMSEEEKQEILNCANYAKEMKVAKIKGKVRYNFQEKILSKIKKPFIKIKDMLPEGRDRLIEGAKSKATNIADSIKEKKENTFRKETVVTNGYNEMSQEILEADEDRLNEILEKAREDLKDGKISTTEFSGLLYSAKNRKNEINNPAPEAEPEPEPEQTSDDR